MRKGITMLTLGCMALGSSVYGQSEQENMMDSVKSTETCSSTCQAENSSSDLVCSLTTPELRERKETVLKSLREQILTKKELEHGYAFKFPGTDEVLDQLSEFIKTERACCAFFIFGLSISGDKRETWLELTGPEGTKEFITTELGF